MASVGAMVHDLRCACIVVSYSVLSRSLASSLDSDSNTTSDAEEATSEKAKKKKEKTLPTGKVVKVNLTAEVTILDLPPPTTADIDFSAGK